MLRLCPRHGDRAAFHGGLGVHVAHVTQEQRRSRDGSIRGRVGIATHPAQRRTQGRGGWRSQRDECVTAVNVDHAVPHLDPKGVESWMIEADHVPSSRHTPHDKCARRVRERGEAHGSDRRVRADQLHVRTGEWSRRETVEHGPANDDGIRVRQHRGGRVNRLPARAPQWSDKEE